MENKLQESKLVLKSAKFMMWIKENHPSYYETYMKNFINERRVTKKEKVLWEIWKNSNGNEI